MAKCLDCERTNEYVKKHGWWCAKKRVNCEHHTVEEDKDGIEVFER